MLAQTVRFVANHWGDLASLTGLLVALVGFGVTIYKTTKAKSAAEAAQRAAEQVKHRLFMVDTISYLTEAVSTVNEIKRLQRAKAWIVLPDRFATLRKLLIPLLGRETGLDNNKKGDIINIVRRSIAIEHRIEKSIHTSVRPPSVSNLNRELSMFTDRLTEVLSEMRVRFGEREDA